MREPLTTGISNDVQWLKNHGAQFNGTLPTLHEGPGGWLHADSNCAPATVAYDLNEPCKMPEWSVLCDQCTDDDLRSLITALRGIAQVLTDLAIVDSPVVAAAPSDAVALHVVNAWNDLRRGELTRLTSTLTHDHPLRAWVADNEPALLAQVELERRRFGGVDPGPAQGDLFLVEVPVARRSDDHVTGLRLVRRVVLTGNLIAWCPGGIQAIFAVPVAALNIEGLTNKLSSAVALGPVLDADTEETWHAVRELVATLPSAAALAGARAVTA